VTEPMNCVRVYTQSSSECDGISVQNSRIPFDKPVLSCNNRYTGALKAPRNRLKHSRAVVHGLVTCNLPFYKPTIPPEDYHNVTQSAGSKGQE
jgi:hypothetical protein